MGQSKLAAKYCTLKSLTLTNVLEMYDVFKQYYNNADQATFFQDMSEKEGVFVLRERDSKRIVGFSTIKRVPLEVDGKKSVGIFSGDTILERQYWGDKSLHMEFLKYVVKLKLANPLTSVYWLLISKGYKTYLLLANNFLDYYPRFDAEVNEKQKQSHQKLQKVTEFYCQEMYEKAFDKANMLLDFGANYQSLKGNIAEITNDMRSKYPKIDFFEERNPTWRRGTELPCVGEISFKLFAHYIRKITRTSSLKSNPIKESAATTEAAATT